MSEGKVCSVCKIFKPLLCFSKQKLGKNGLRSYCKDCNSVLIKEYRIKNIE